MNPREIKKVEKQLKHIQHVPLEGPDLDDAFYVFAVQVNSESSTGKRKLTFGRPYYRLDGFKIHEDRILVSKDRYKKTVTVSGKNNDERITRPVFDHWFPKSRFPLLSLNLYNLIPCCAVCNSGAKGDKVFQLTQFVHPYEQKDDDPKFKFVPAITDKDKGEWTVVLDRDKGAHQVDNTIKAFELDRIYDMHGPLEVKEMMEFAQAYSNTYLSQIYNQMSVDLGSVGFSQEEVYRMLFGTESIPTKYLDRPLSKMKYDILEYLKII